MNCSFFGGGACFILSFSSPSKGWLVGVTLAPLVAGVPQGSPFSPLSFSLFIDDMADVLEFSKLHMYAGDLQIYYSRPRDLLSEYIWEVKSDLRKIFEWSSANLLSLNPAKSMVLPVYRGHLLGPFPPLFLHSHLLRLYIL
jgi:hypothetical protein